MPDREKVIEGFEISYRYSNVDDGNTLVPQQLVLDAITLLKAQEPIEPIIVDTDSSRWYHIDMFKNYYCGNCGEFLHIVNKKDLFCSQCGRAVKWR